MARYEKRGGKGLGGKADKLIIDFCSEKVHVNTKDDAVLFALEETANQSQALACLLFCLREYHRRIVGFYCVSHATPDDLRSFVLDALFMPRFSHIFIRLIRFYYLLFS